MEAWTTREAVIKDLAEAMGSKVARLDEQYLVIGERPPPRNLTALDQDEDLDLLFGSGGNIKNNGIIQDSRMDPDLAGITKMLQMVNIYNGAEDDYKDAVNTENTVVTISKVTSLNPHVKEFVPRGAIDSSPSCSNIDDRNNHVNLIDKGKPDVMKVGKSDNMKLKGLNVQDLKYDDFKVIEDKLKSTINDASKLDTFESKRQKNVAIATLLKLHAAKSPSPKSQNSDLKCITLMTPEDFVKTKNVLSESDISVALEGSLLSKHPTQESSSLEQLSWNKAQTSNSSPVQKEEPIIPTKSSNSILCPEVEASIAKVNRWFDGPVIKKSPTICLEPVTFKKKVISVNSSTSKVDENSNTPEYTIKQYKPSNYATDLSKKYQEKQQKIAKNKKVNMWSNLEDILKAKDLEIKKKQEAASLNQSTTMAPVDST